MGTSGFMASVGASALKPEIRILPRTDQQVSIMGRNGSGKTQCATWILSYGKYDQQPYIVIDYKYDPLLNAIPMATQLPVKTSMPKAPGIYIIHPLPSETDEVEELLWKIWDSGNIGLMVDEAHMIPNKGAFQAILTQGRSKNIPRIILTQRPAWVNRFVFSEANFYIVFHLNDHQDRKRVMDFLPVNLSEPIPKYHSWHHYVDDYKTVMLKPVPRKEHIIENFSSRMPKRWFGYKPPSSTQPLKARG